MYNVCEYAYDLFASFMHMFQGGCTKYQGDLNVAVKAVGPQIKICRLKMIDILVVSL